MRDLERALADITAIRSQMAQGTLFCGYGPATVAATGVLAAVMGGVQAFWIPNPAHDIVAYLALWVVTAVVSVILIGIEMVARTRRIHSGFADEMLRATAEQFIPAGVTGALLTVVLFRFAPQNLWMLPGLWQIAYSLGLFAACRTLPRPMFAAAVWYLTTGLACIAFASDALAFSPWAMALPFGVGQLFIAGVLYRSTGEVDGKG